MIIYVKVLEIHLMIKLFEILVININVRLGLVLLIYLIYMHDIHQSTSHDEGFKPQKIKKNISTIQSTL